MSFAHGSSTRVLANAKEISSEISGWSVQHNRAVSEVTVVGQTAGNAGANFIPSLMSGTLGLRGPQDSNPATGLSAELLAAVYGADNLLMVTCLPDGVTIGKPSFFCVSDMTDYAIDATVSDAVAMTMQAMADESVEMGYVVSALQAYTADALTGTAVDRGASPITPTTRGGVFGMHVTAYSGFTNVVVKVQHSPDNVSWADLATFTTVTAVGRERIAVANGVTVNRYLRSSIDVTGSGSVTLLVSAAPR